MKMGKWDNGEKERKRANLEQWRQLHPSEGDLNNTRMNE